MLSVSPPQLLTNSPNSANHDVAGVTPLRSASVLTNSVALAIADSASPASYTSAAPPILNYSAAPPNSSDAPADCVNGASLIAAPPTSISLPDAPIAPPNSLAPVASQRRRDLLLDEAFEPSQINSPPPVVLPPLRLAFNSLKNMAARRLAQQRALAKLAPHLLPQLSSIDSLLEQCIIGNKTRDARPAELEPLSAVVLRSSSRAAVFMFRHRRRRLCVFY